MRLKSSIQPTSTSRSPRKGSRPVVSVSRTISRISLETKISGESDPPPRHFNNLIQNVADTRPHGIKTMRSIHHEIGPLALLGIRQLPRKNSVELFAGHVFARQNSLALDFRRGRDDDHGIHPRLATRFI